MLGAPADVERVSSHGGQIGLCLKSSGTSTSGLVRTSAVAVAVSGTRWNGLAFFGLTGKGRKEQHRAEE